MLLTRKKYIHVLYIGILIDILNKYLVFKYIYKIIFLLSHYFNIVF